MVDAEDLLSCLRGGSFGRFGTLAVEVMAGVEVGLPPGRGGGMRDDRSEGSLVSELTLVKLEKDVEADALLVLLFFLAGSCGVAKVDEECVAIGEEDSEAVDMVS